MNRDNALRTARLRLIGSMMLFGTIGLFRRSIALPSGLIAYCRGLVGCISLLLLLRLRGGRLHMQAIRRNAAILALSGAAMGFNWILLFEAYRYTSVAEATLCYYMAPVIVIVLSPILLGERLGWKKGVCVLAAAVGMVLISGATDPAAREPGAWRGTLLGLGAAGLYAAVVLLNKRLRQIGAYERTVVQLLAAGLVLMPYVLTVETLPALHPDMRDVLLLLTVCIVHTGLAYALFFGAVSVLPAQTAAILSYLDPITALLLSALLLHEHLGAAGVVGAVLLLGAAAVSEALPQK